MLIDFLKKCDNMIVCYWSFFSFFFCCWKLQVTSNIRLLGAHGHFRRAYASKVVIKKGFRGARNHRCLFPLDQSGSLFFFFFLEINKVNIKLIGCNKVKSKK